MESKSESYQFSFEKLEVWQLSRKLASEIYLVTNSFPAEEKFGIINQLRRAAVSVSSNIAEGVARKSVKEQIYMLERSYGSCTEIVCQLIISGDMNFISQTKLQEIRLLLQEITNKLNTYVNYLKSKQTA